MRRNVGFTSIAIVTLALATGALTTVFNLAIDFLFRPLPAEHPNELVRVSATRRHGSINAPASWPDYVRFRDHTTTLAGLAAHYPTAPLFVSVRNNAQEINGSVVSANYFPLLGIQPLLGRFFRPAEDAVPDRDRVAVISYALWSRWFGASPDALGAAVRINSVPFTVIGAAPRNFRGVISAPSEIYIPAMMLGVGYRWCDDSLSEDCTILSMLGRMAAGRTVQEVGAEIASLMPPRWEHAEEGDNRGTVVRSDRGADRSETTMLLMRLLLLVGLVLLAVNCANLAGMALARGAARTRESAVRVSLGAGRFRLMRQLLSESVLLALAGGAGGILFSLALTGALQQMFFSLDDEGHPLWYDFTIEPWVIFDGAGGLCAGRPGLRVAPALRATRVGPIDGLKSRSASVSQRSRLGHWLVGAQAAIAVALAVVSGLLAGSVRTLSTGVNFEPTHVALMRLRPRLLKYTPHRAQRFQREAIQRLEHTPGVESASAAPSASSSRNRARSSLPLTRTSSTLPGAASARGWRPAPRTRLFGG